MVSGVSLYICLLFKGVRHLKEHNAKILMRLCGDLKIFTFLKVFAI